MFLDRIHRRIAELTDAGCIETGDVVPSTEEEILALERKLGFRLPGAVRELYRWGGADLGRVFGGSDLMDGKEQMATDYRRAARQTLEDAGENPGMLDAKTLIVQMDCDGQFSFIRADRGDDPAVFTHNEQEPTFCSCERFTDYLALIVEQTADTERIECVRSMGDLDRLLASSQEVLQMWFAGGMQLDAVPDRVFDFQELRSLNLVGKGLRELSPRIGELAFLRRLDLARNSLSSLPAELAGLDELEELDLADNRLTTAIDILLKLPALRYCCLARNPLSAVEAEKLHAQLPHVALVFS